MRSSPAAHWRKPSLWQLSEITGNRADRTRLWGSSRRRIRTQLSPRL